MFKTLHMTKKQTYGLEWGLMAVFQRLCSYGSCIILFKGGKLTGPYGACLDTEEAQSACPPLFLARQPIKNKHFTLTKQKSI